MPPPAKNSSPVPSPDSSAIVDEITRHQLDLLLPHTRPYLGSTNLDIGCGSGITSAIHQRELGIAPTLCDVEDIRHELARPFPFFLLQSGPLPLSPKSFASSYFQYVLHHLPSENHTANLLAEAHRVSRRIIIVEEIAGPRTDIARAKEFDQEVNARLHPGVLMPVHKYYSQDELEQLLKNLGHQLIFHAVASTGSPANGFLETHVFCAE